MLSIYPACFFKETDGSYSVIFPDLNNLATCGENMEDAMAMAVDCLAGYIYTCEKDGDKLPAPSPMTAISPENIARELDTEPGEYFINMVSVDVKSYAKEHITGGTSCQNAHKIMPPLHN